MITYRYGPYKPEDESIWDIDRLMALLSEMILKYDIELDEALQMLINRGLPVNIFLKDGGIDDLVASFIEKLNKQISAFLTSFLIQSAVTEALKDVKNARNPLKKKLQSQPGLLKKLDKAIESASLDQLLQLKWEMRNSTNVELAGNEINNLVQLLEEYNILIVGSKKYKFVGKKPLSKSEALKLLKHLDELELLKEKLNEALANGDILNFDLENLAKYLGAESYLEFLERREKIFKKMKEFLKNKGRIIEDETDGRGRLSPTSIRKIGRHVLEEVFKDFKTDANGGMHETSEPGESEYLSSKTKSFEFGDNLTAIDLSSSIINAFMRSGSPKPNFSDIEIFEGRGHAKSSTVILLDMSGSMMRSDRFYNAKKVVLALDSLIRNDFRDDSLTIVGFGSLARVYTPAQIPTLQPFPVSMFNPHIRLRLDLSGEKKGTNKFLPLYFTNLQRAMQLGRTLLCGSDTRNKQIILITDGVPTAHFEESILHINYPPSPGDFGAALREVKKCRDAGITINTFLLTSDWEMNYFGEESFIHQFSRHSSGRIFYPHPFDLNKMILVDFIANKKTQFNIKATR